MPTITPTTWDARCDELLDFAAIDYLDEQRRLVDARVRFGLSTVEYYVTLRWLVAQPEAAERHPLLVARLRRQWAARRAARSAGRLA